MASQGIGARPRRESRRGRPPEYARAAMLNRRHFLVGGLAAAACAALRRGAARARRRIPRSACRAGDAGADGATIWCRATRPGPAVRRVGAARFAATAGGRPAGGRGDRPLRRAPIWRGCRPARASATAATSAAPPARAGEAAEGSLHHRAGRSARDLPGLVGRRVRPGLGAQPGRRRLPDLRRHGARSSRSCSSAPATSSTPTIRCCPEVRLPDGRVWRNGVSPAKARVAESLADFRGNFAYNLEDPAMRRFAAATADRRPVGRPRGAQQLVPGRRPPTAIRATGRAPRAGAGRAGALRALFEYVPFGAARRSAGSPPHRARAAGRPLHARRAQPTAPPTARATSRRRARPTALLGDAPAGLARERARRHRARCGRSSPATCRSAWWCRDERHVEAFAQGAGLGPRPGASTRSRACSRFLHERRIANVLFVTADVHYPAAHLYHPDAARFGPFTPFHELVAGPLARRRLRPQPARPDLRPDASCSSGRRPRPTRRRGTATSRSGASRSAGRAASSRPAGTAPTARSCTGWPSRRRRA